ncbi:MAG TPA: amidohydrolase family protein [Chthoniobacterales bacterium]|jgi:imidazolonepropionase-like amidohydrolase|nr:amidohydrolase family protein [Chthoniobacterales bacterium]
MKRVLCCVSLCFLAINLRASDTMPAPPQAKPIVIKGATIHPVSGPEIPSGTIVFENGKITAIGADAAAPPGAEVIDGSGKHVYPGLINANTVLGLVEIGAVRATVDVEESGAINPNVRSLTSINPDSELIPVARSAGVLTALSVPEGGLISGQSTVLRLDGWTPEEMSVLSPAAMHLRWPNMTIDRGPRARKTIKDQQKEIDKAQKQIRDAFQTARAYWQARKNPPADFKTDLRWEALMPVFESKLPLYVHAGKLAQIEAALAWARENQFKIVLVDAEDAWRVAPQLKETDTAVILGPSTSIPQRRDDDYDSSWSNAAKLQAAGVRFCIASGGRRAETNERNVGYEAGLAAGYGLPKEEALKAVTIYPAQILGVSDRLGTLETGKAATLIVTNGDPLDFPTQVEIAFVDGRKIDLSNRQTRLRDKYREKYRRK